MTTPPTTELGYRLLGDIRTESDEWYAVRQNRLGGSEIAAVLGLSPYESPFSLWHRKKGLVGPQELNPEMDWGQRLEDDVMTKFYERHPELVSIGRGVFVSNTRPWQLASPDDRAVRLADDGQITENVLVETKTSPYGEGWGDGPGDIPIYVKCQVQWYLDVFGMSRAYIPVLISGYDYREYVYEHNQDEADFLRGAAEEFIWSLENNVRPDIDTHSQTYQAVRTMHPLIDGSRLEVLDPLGEAFIRAKIAESDAASEFQRQRSLLADAMGEAKDAYWGGVKLADRRAKGEGTPYVQANGEKALRAGLDKHTTIRAAVAARMATEATAAPTLTLTSEGVSA